MKTIAFVGGRILTMDPSHPSPGAVVVKGARIEAVGSRDLVRAYPEAEIRDLGAEETLVPGFIDAHNHLCVACFHPHSADLQGVADQDEALARIAAHAKRYPHEEWVHAVEWNDRLVHLDRAALDSLGVDRPILVASFSYHLGVVDSRGLDLLGIGAASDGGGAASDGGGAATGSNTDDPPGGVIERDERGRPTGRLFERAWSPAFARADRGPADLERWARLVEARAKTLVSYGITAVHDTACSPAAEVMYALLAREGRLPLSVLMLPHPARLLDRLDPARLDGPPTGEGDEQLRVGPIKLFADGGIQPACEATLGGQRVSFGIRMPGLAEDVRAASARGFDVAIHALGNRAIEDALEALAAAEPARRAGQRIRIEHVLLSSLAQARRIAAMDITAVVQPAFLEENLARSAGIVFDDASWLPFATLASAGVRVAGSSDSPCGAVEPLEICGYGESRRSRAGEWLAREESLPFTYWLEAYTRGAAAAGGQETERGSISPGKRADLVVLSGALAPGRATVAETWIAGARAYWSG